MQISFGSDGYRGILGHTFTREALARIMLACGSYINELYPGQKDLLIPIGYDTRFMARDMAHYAARIIAHLGYKPQVVKRACPSPYLAFATRQLEAPLGIQLTASHNPPYYCGVKLKGIHGGSLFPQHADLVESLSNIMKPQTVADIQFVGAKEDRHSLDVDKAYKQAILEAAGWEGDGELELLVDFMHGAGGGIYREVLEQGFSVDSALNAAADPLFGGAKPEPSPERLKELMRMVAIGGSRTIGLAFDGDGDRLAVIDEQGEFLAPHEIFCLLLEHLALHLGKRGVVVTTVSFSGLTDRVAKAYGCTIHNVPVGFKHVSRSIIDHQAIIGGEESGGTGFGHYLPERDALLMALLLLHARQLSGTTLHEMVAQLYATYGRPVFIRRDVPLDTTACRDNIIACIRDLASLDKVAGDTVTSLNHVDGMKLRTEAGWVLVRASGTEPLLRIYAEGNSAEQAEAYATAVLQVMKVKS